jgi:CRP/FNR family cyclic AMP-dependent transcriptional regulator
LGKRISSKREKWSMRVKTKRQVTIPQRIGEKAKGGVKAMDSSFAYLFRGLDERQMKKIEAIGKEISMKKGQQIFKEGQEANGVYVIREGCVELMTIVEKGFELPISILRNAGDTFGTSALVPPYQYSLSARCAEDVVFFYMETAALRKLVAVDQDIGCQIMTNLAAYFLERLKETRQEVKIHFKTLLLSTRS